MEMFGLQYYIVKDSQKSWQDARNDCVQPSPNFTNSKIPNPPLANNELLRRQIGVKTCTFISSSFPQKTSKWGHILRIVINIQTSLSFPEKVAVVCDKNWLYLPSIVHLTLWALPQQDWKIRAWGYKGMKSSLLNSLVTRPRRRIRGPPLMACGTPPVIGGSEIFIETGVPGLIDLW